MRSLEEWTKYLEQQEQSLEDEPRQERAPEPPKQSNFMSVSTQAPAPTPAPPPTAEIEAPAEPTAKKVDPVKQTVSAKDSTEKASKKPVQHIAHLTKQLPKRLLASDTPKEVAQSSYKGFKESRDELLERLLDPQISLEDAARILNVCPTTVRRYTNRGLLKHYRTAGNQRRFRLSDVLVFMESQLNGRGIAE